MTMGLADTIRNNHVNDIRDKIDAGAAAGVLEIWTDPRPAKGAAPGGTLLGTLTFSDPSAPNASAGVLTFNSITSDTSADATGTATWARAKDSDATFVADMSVSESGGGGEIILNSTSITVGGTIEVTSGTITAGNA